MVLSTLYLKLTTVHNCQKLLIFQGAFNQFPFFGFRFIDQQISIQHMFKNVLIDRTLFLNKTTRDTFPKIVNNTLSFCNRRIVNYTNNITCVFLTTHSTNQMKRSTSVAQLRIKSNGQSIWNHLIAIYSIAGSLNCPIVSLWACTVRSCSFAEAKLLWSVEYAWQHNILIYALNLLTFFRLSVPWNHIICSFYCIFSLFPSL